MKRRQENYFCNHSLTEEDNENHPQPKPLCHRAPRGGGIRHNHHPIRAEHELNNPYTQCGY